jgi:hypothetical protein
MRSTDADLGAAGGSSLRPVRDRVTRDEDLRAEEAEEGESGMSGLSYEYLR